ncbi:MAG TPA: HDIG domain-containing protein [Spirochaetia bacterium]|nr:HDIG domain-containing protein [Spirochaetia bacterium]
MRSDRAPLRAGVERLARRLRVETWTVVSVGVAFAATFAVVLAATQTGSLTFRSGAPLPAVGTAAERDYVVERDFPYVDDKATAMKRDAREKLVPPVFTFNDDLSADVLQTFDRLAEALKRFLGQGLSPATLFQKIQADFPGRLSREELDDLARRPDLAQTMEAARGVVEVALSRGIVDLEAHQGEAMTAGAIEQRRVQEGLARSEIVPLEQVLTADSVVSGMEARVRERARDDDEAADVLALLRAFAVKNCFYDAALTADHRKRARADVDPVVEKLARGQVLVRRGEVVTIPIALKLQALRAFSRTVDVNGIVGSALFLLLIFGLTIYLLSVRGTSVSLRRSAVILFLGLGLGHVAVSALVVRFVGLPDWVPAAAAIPTAAMSMLTAILVSTPVGLFFTLAVSLSLLLLTGMSVQSFLFAFLSGVAATAVVLDAEKRLDLIRAGIFLSLLEVLILEVLGVLANEDPSRFLPLALWGFGNGFLCSILTLGFLPVFEHLLKAPTRFKLMELSDLNSPVFKRMLSLAPGTYTHSISVANLAETACEAIGANALLARVSAYYHDIGKVDQADYFIENQKAYNRHDEMKPSLSVAVIKSHVRIGIEKAKELKLPHAIIDIIAQHHGRGLITYFYNRALKEGRNPRVSREDYSYPGVRPKTKEAAVLMLADAVEAASRTLKRPTEARLESFVQEMIMEKFNSGELGDSSLTLRDLESIRKSFVHILEGYFHTRIEYPKLAQARGEERSDGRGEARSAGE